MSKLNGRVASMPKQVQCGREDGGQGLGVLDRKQRDVDRYLVRACMPLHGALLPQRQAEKVERCHTVQSPRNWEWVSPYLLDATEWQDGN
jgi:hypothetical protein